MNQKVMWDDKPYYSLNSYLKEEYGQKLYKLSLDGGMTCPNRDGKIGHGGCIFCSSGGSGDFAASRTLSITDQIEQAKDKVKHKVKSGTQYIAYFQAFTNTYAPVEYLEKIFLEAIMHPDVAILSIATRPDCLGNDILALLERLNKIKPVWVELGLQTIHEQSASFIRRGYPLSVFKEAVSALNKCQIDIIVHLIVGLPFESEEDLLESVRYVCNLPIQGIKLQLLHILKNTDLSKYIDKFHILEMDEYIDWIIDCVEHIPKHIVIHRITGDGPKNLLIAPTWSSNKKLVLNTMHKTMKERNTWQGKLVKEV
ncbi:predicted Fe-S oxidoreductase [Lachnospiraceae bacterium KM106-2]|nr:predicted Fe-S oxidoreductase [Lachnospiraceae bacterium KM106-2]